MKRQRLYQRGDDGEMQHVVPEAQGKAAALSAYLAQGGTTFKYSGKFKKGPMRGKNADEATAQFERMWATAPDSVKEKYASRSQVTDMAPSERRIAAERAANRPPLDPAKVAKYGRKLAQTYADTEAAKTPKTATTPARPPATPPGSSFAELTKAPATPAGGAQSVGDGSSPENGYTPTRRPQAGDEAQITAIKSQIAANDTSTPLSRGVDSVANGIYSGVMKAGNAIASPFVPDAQTAAVDQSLQNDTQNRDNRLAEQAAARNSQVSEIKGSPIPLATTPPSPTLTATTPAQPTTPQAQAPAPPQSASVGTPPMLRRPEESASKPVRINSLTKLPFGYRTGDAVAPAQQAEADASVMRQKQASSNGALVSQQRQSMTATTPAQLPVPRGPASQPALVGSSLNDPNNAFSKEAYARTDAAMAKGVKRQEELSRAVNVDSPKKFYTGRVLPLDQLVNRPKPVMTATTPARPQFARR